MGMGEWEKQGGQTPLSSSQTQPQTEFSNCISQYATNDSEQKSGNTLL